LKRRTRKLKSSFGSFPPLTRQDSQKKKCYLLNLPIDLICEIFDYLHPIYATCLGLTCKVMYPIYRSLGPKRIGLERGFYKCWQRWVIPFSKRPKHILAGLLAEWMAPLIFTFEVDVKGKHVSGTSMYMSKVRYKEKKARGRPIVRFWI
jgi:hypothetical protein